MTVSHTDGQADRRTDRHLWEKQYVSPGGRGGGGGEGDIIFDKLLMPFFVHTKFTNISQTLSCISLTPIPAQAN